MKRIEHLDQLTREQRFGALSIGNFDGVHLGHAKLIERLKVHAARVGGPAVVFTFDPHPAQLLRPSAVPPPLTTSPRKAELLGVLGVDLVITYPTSQALLNLSAEQFFAEIIGGRLAARAVVEGPNFCFGKDRTGTTERLAQLCRAANVALEIVEPVMAATGDVISSSRIRSDLDRGAVAAATAKLGRPYRIAGRVVQGAQRGRQLGFPTANLDAIATLVPGVGVYAGRGLYRDQAWPAAIHIGPNPTFADRQRKVEVHLVGFSGSLYDDVLEVDFLDRLRDIHNFDSIEDLTRQLHVDVAAATETFQHARIHFRQDV